LFQLEADENVQVVGDLIGLCADESGAHDVHSAIEIIQPHIRQLLREEGSQDGEVMLPEGLAAPDHVFPQARLGFVERHRRAAGQGRALEALRRSLFVQGVPALVDAAEKGGLRAIAEQARGQPDIIAPEVGGEGMRRLILPPTVEVVAHIAQDDEGEIPLSPHVVVSLQEAVINRLAPLGDGLQQRRQPRLEVVEKPADLGGPHSRLEILQQGIVRLLFIAQGIGDAARDLDHALQVRLEERDVVFGAGLSPGLEGQGSDFRLLGDELRGDFRGPVVVTSQHAHEARVVRVEVHAGDFGLGGFEPARRLFGGEELVRERAERGALFPSRRCAAGRHVDLLIPSQESSRSVEVIIPLQMLLQLFNLFSHA